MTYKRVKNEKTLNWAERITKNQLDFQKLAEIPIDSEDLAVKLDLTEGFILKAVEELVELRKTMPSSFNKYAKTQPEINLKRTMEELCDVQLFLINIGLVWGFTLDEMLSTISYVQANNFIKIREKIATRAQKERADALKGGKLF